MAFYLHTVGKKYLDKVHCATNKNKKIKCKKDKSFFDYALSK